MHTRRSLLGAVGAAGMTTLAGCSWILGDTIESEAAQAAVSEQALAETGYTHERTDDFAFEDEVHVRDESRDVRLTNWIVQYNRSIEQLDIDAATYSIVSSPTVSIAGRDFNPFREFDEERLLEELMTRAGLQGMSDLEKVGERPVSILDQEITISEFTAESDEGDLPLLVHLGTLTNDGDFLTVIAAHPDQLEETPFVDSLAAGTEHPAE